MYIHGSLGQILVSLDGKSDEHYPFLKMEVLVQGLLTQPAKLPLEMNAFHIEILGIKSCPCF